MPKLRKSPCRYRSRFLGLLSLVGALAPSAASAAESAPPTGPLDLASAVEIALRENPSARESEARVAAAKAAQTQAQAGFWPRAELKVGYSGTNNPAYSFFNILNQRAFSPTIDFNDVDATDDFQASGNIEMPLFMGMKRFAAGDAAEHGLAAAEASGQITEAELATQVGRAWFGVHKARDFVVAAKAAVDAFEQNLELAKRREAGGTLLRQAVLEIEVGLAQAQENLSRAQNGEALALAGLRALLGLRGNAALDVAALETVPLPSDARKERPELTAAAAAVRAAESAVGIEKADWYPQVGLTASLIYDRGVFANDGDMLSYMAGIGASWRIWDGMLTAGKVEAAEARVAELRAQHARAELGMDFQVEQARIKARDAETRVEVSAKAISLAEESVQLARARFGEGLAVPTQLVDAETALTGARIRHAEAKTDLQIAHLELRRALGLSPVPHGDAR